MKFMLEIARNRQFLVTYVWNRQLFTAIPYEATAALTNTCKYKYIYSYSWRFQTYVTKIFISAALVH